MPQITPMAANSSHPRLLKKTASRHVSRQESVCSMPLTLRLLPVPTDGTPVSVLHRLVTPRVLPWLVGVLGVAMLAALTPSATASYLVRTATALAAAAVLLRADRTQPDGLRRSRR